MEVYALISWDYKPSRTTIRKLSLSKEELLEEVREAYHDRIYDDCHDEGLTDEQINAIADQMSYADLEDWMWGNTDYVIDSYLP